MLAEYFLFLATTYHFWVQIIILILVCRLQTLWVEFGLGEVWPGIVQEFQCSNLPTFLSLCNICLFSLHKQSVWGVSEFKGAV